MTQHLHVWGFVKVTSKGYLYKCIVRGCNETYLYDGFTGTTVAPSTKVL